jgi:hypothetical protein
MPVSQLPAPCWVLGANDSEFVPHFASEAEARMQYATDSEPGALATIRALDEPCWIAVCDGPGGSPFGTCDEEFEDDEGGSHGADRTVTEQWITACGWKIARDGRVFGPCCGDQCPPGDEAVTGQVPGQLTLDGQEVANG